MGERGVGKGGTGRSEERGNCGQEATYERRIKKYSKKNSEVISFNTLIYVYFFIVDHIHISPPTLPSPPPKLNFNSGSSFLSLLGAGIMDKH